MDAALFWNQNTFPFELLCGPVAPTLLDVASITVLMPIGEKYFVGSFEKKIDPKTLNWEKISFRGFTENHRGGLDDQIEDPIIEGENLVFMLYWVFINFNCTKSIQFPTSFYNLAQLLRTGVPRLYLAKLLLTNVYQAFANAANGLR